MENFKNCAESLVQIYQNYDILFLDAYGVLKAENGKLFPLVPELLSLMKNNGKKIYIISNSSQNSEILKNLMLHVVFYPLYMTELSAPAIC